MSRVKLRDPASEHFCTNNFRFALSLRFTWRVIDTDEQLEALLARIGRAGWVALDTEADSLHAYPEKLCLLQISLPGADELLDPLAAMEIGPLIEVLRKRELIMHGADYDLRLLRRTYEFVPESVVDTMLAARLHGFTEFGLTSLVEKLLGVRLEKGSQTADWAKRPLTERMINYARNDTHHLKPLWDRLKSRLEDSGRLHWHKESCARLVKECAEVRAADPDQTWRVKGADKLDRRALAVLRELWHWRDGEAVAANRPPFFILRHDTLVALAQAAVVGKNVESLLPARLAQRRREGVLVAVRRGLGLPASQWPQPNRYSTPRSNAGEKRRYEELRQRRDRRAAELSIDPTLIASRATLSAVARDWDAAQTALMAWQRELLEH
ncbi:MAG TPA: HRDC domain-containing protein [Candidatus Angelobacter sp.]|nr:HRDC domain-containing protein [Candidatus Angelobacter sp.]